MNLCGSGKVSVVLTMMVDNISKRVGNIEKNIHVNLNIE